MSKSDYALVHNVIPAMDALSVHLDKFRDGAKYHPIIRVSAARGLEMLNKYYSRTDECEIYRISMSKIMLIAREQLLTLFFFSPQSCLQALLLQGEWLAPGMDRRGRAAHHRGMDLTLQAASPETSRQAASRQSHSTESEYNVAYMSQQLSMLTNFQHASQ